MLNHIEVNDRLTRLERFVAEIGSHISSDSISPELEQFVAADQARIDKEREEQSANEPGEAHDGGPMPPEGDGTDPDAPR